MRLVLGGFVNMRVVLEGGIWYIIDAGDAMGM